MTTNTRRMLARSYTTTRDLLIFQMSHTKLTAHVSASSASVTVAARR